jgi:hypothetical protein
MWRCGCAEAGAEVHENEAEQKTMMQMGTEMRKIDQVKAAPLWMTGIEA